MFGYNTNHSLTANYMFQVQCFLFVIRTLSSHKILSIKNYKEKKSLDICTYLIFIFVFLKKKISYVYLQEKLWVGWYVTCPLNWVDSNFLIYKERNKLNIIFYSGIKLIQNSEFRQYLSFSFSPSLVETDAVFIYLFFFWIIKIALLYACSHVHTLCSIKI